MGKDLSPQDHFLNCYSEIKMFSGIQTYKLDSALPEPCQFLPCEYQFLVGVNGERWPVYVQPIEPTETTLLATMIEKLSLKENEQRDPYAFEKKYFGHWDLIDEKRGAYQCQKIMASFKLSAIILLAYNNEAAVAYKIPYDISMTAFFDGLSMYNGKPV